MIWMHYHLANIINGGLISMTPEEFDNLQLTKDDFKITIDGVLIKYNSNIIDLILKRQIIVNKIKEIIKELDVEIKGEEDNLKNIASGFQEMTYRMIDRMKSEKKVLERIMGEPK